MKKSILLGILTLVLVGCIENTPESILGTWVQTPGDDPYTYSEIRFEANNECICQQIGCFIQTMDTFYYSVSGNELTIRTKDPFCHYMSYTTEFAIIGNYLFLNKFSYDRINFNNYKFIRKK